MKINDLKNNVKIKRWLIERFIKKDVFLVTMITFGKDPFLFDKATDFRNYKLLKDLINKKQDLVFLQDDILNLYSALVKKCDFKKHKNQQNILFRRVPSFCGAKIKTYFLSLLDKKYDQKTHYKKFREEVGYYCGLKNRIPCHQFNNWLTRNEIPFPAVRVLSLKYKNDKEILATFVLKVHRIKGVTNSFLPLKKLNEVLANKNIYLIGAAFGDGGFENENSWVLVDGGRDEQEVKQSVAYLKFIAKLLNQVYRIDKVRTYHYPHKIVLGVDNKFFCRFINFFYDLPFGYKTEKLQLSKILKKAKENFFWRGLGDTDGSYRKFSKTFSIGMSQKKLLKEFSLFLRKENIKHSRRGIHLNISTENLNKFAEVVGSSHPRKQKELMNQLSGGPTHQIFRGVNKKNLTLSYFDLSKMPSLRVYLEDKFSSIFENLTISQIMAKTNVSRQTVHNWKNNSTAIPFYLLKIFHRDNLFNSLSDKASFTIGLKGSNKVFLPIRLNQTILKYASLVRPSRRGLCLNVRKNPLTLTYKQEIENYFGVTFNYTSKKEYLCESSILNVFFQTFFNYQKPWEKYSKKELKILKKKWDSFV